MQSEIQPTLELLIKNMSKPGNYNIRLPLFTAAESAFIIFASKFPTEASRVFLLVSEEGFKNACHSKCCRKQTPNHLISRIYG